MIGKLDCFFDKCLVRNRGPIPHDPARCSEQHIRFARLDSLGESVGRKAAEHDRVNSSQTIDGKHANQRSRDHGHVQHDHITLLDPCLSQDPGQRLDLPEEGVIRDGLLCIRDRAVVVDGRFMSVSCRDVPVYAIVARRDFSAGEPFPHRVRGAIWQTLLGCPECRVRFSMPVKALGLA